MTDEFKTMTITQARGPAYRFKGRRVLTARWQNAQHPGVEHHAQVWETPDLALVASFRTDDDEGRQVKAMAFTTGSKTERQVAVLDFFEWHPRVRAAAKEAGWSLMLEVG